MIATPSPCGWTPANTTSASFNSSQVAEMDAYREAEFIHDLWDQLQIGRLCLAHKHVLFGLKYLK